MAKPKPQILYTIKSMSVPNQYQISKMSKDLEVLAAYVIREEGHSLICTCPARKPWCKHCEILRLFQAEQKINLGWFLDFDTKEWIPPVTLEDYVA